MPIKLHRCGWMWFKANMHPCWKVQQALDEAGIDYEVVKHPAFPRGSRKELIAKTGQKVLPAIEFEDGRILREESKDMAARIRSGELEQGAPTDAGQASSGQAAR